MQHENEWGEYLVHTLFVTEPRVQFCMNEQNTAHHITDFVWLQIGSVLD